MRPGALANSSQCGGEYISQGRINDGNATKPLLHTQLLRSESTFKAPSAPPAHPIAKSQGRSISSCPFPIHIIVKFRESRSIAYPVLTQTKRSGKANLATAQARAARFLRAKKQWDCRGADSQPEKRRKSIASGGASCMCYTLCCACKPSWEFTHMV